MSQKLFAREAVSILTLQHFRRFAPCERLPGGTDLAESPIILLRVLRPYRIAASERPEFDSGGPSKARSPAVLARETNERLQSAPHFRRNRSGLNSGRAVTSIA